MSRAIFGLFARSRRRGFSLGIVVLCWLVFSPSWSSSQASAQTPAQALPPASEVVDWLILEAPLDQASTLEEVAEDARAILPRLEERLGGPAKGPFRMILLPPGAQNDRFLRQLDSAAPSWAAGFVLSEARLGAIRLASVGRYPYEDLSSVLAHEIVHVLLGDHAGADLPRWFNEGVAVREQRRWGFNDAWTYSSSLLSGPFPFLDQMDRAFRSSPGSAKGAYAASFAFVDWSAKHYGPDFVPRMVQASRIMPFDEAWEQTSGVSLAESEERWRRRGLWLYRWLPAVTGAGSLWMGITGLFLLASWRRRVKTRALEEGWEAGEAEELEQALARSKSVSSWSDDDVEAEIEPAADGDDTTLVN